MEHIERMMELAEFPEDAKLEVRNVWLLLQRKEKTALLKKEAERLADLPSEKRALGKELESLTLSWEKELHIHRYTLELLFLLECWVITCERYQQAGLPEEIFVRTLHDLHCKLMECRRVYEVNGVFVGHWYDRFFELSRFAIGRLQFELIPYPLDEPVEVMGRTIRKNDWVINMHIPSEGPLAEDAVEDSLARARAFFKAHEKDLILPAKFSEEDGAVYEGKLEEPMVFVMDSWLLDPDLHMLLPKGNIRTFTERFQVMHVQKEETFADGWRVYGKEWKKSPCMLPAETTLQKRIASHLAKGGKLGEGFGVLMR